MDPTGPNPRPRRMDPTDPASFTLKTVSLPIAAGGRTRTYEYVDEVPARWASSDPTLLCLHGFPDLWYGYRHQIAPWTHAGYRVIVPSMLGYGHTDAPAPPEAYTTRRLCGELMALVDHCLGVGPGLEMGVDVKRSVVVGVGVGGGVGGESGLDVDGKRSVSVKRSLSGVNLKGPVVVVGHDWGAWVAARVALWFPGRVEGVVLMSVPYTPPSREYVPIQQIAATHPNLAYQAFFSEERATDVVEGMLPEFMKTVWAVPDDDGPGFVIREPEPDTGSESEEGDKDKNKDKDKDKEKDKDKDKEVRSLLTPQEFDYYHSQLKKGMNGPLNYYRTSQLRHEEEKGLSPYLREDLPMLFLWGTRDTTCVPSVVAKAHKFVPRLQVIAMEGKGHWLPVEGREEVTGYVLGWLESLAIVPRACARL